jgi:hypothetical protein
MDDARMDEEIGFEDLKQKLFTNIQIDGGHARVF